MSVCGKIVPAVDEYWKRHCAKSYRACADRGVQCMRRV